MLRMSYNKKTILGKLLSMDFPEIISMKKWKGGKKS